MKKVIKSLDNRVEFTKLILIKLVILSMALGSIICFLTSAGGIILAIAGGLMVFTEVYNAITQEKEKEDEE